MPLFTKASKLCQCGFGHMCTSCQSPLWFEHPTTSVYLYKVGCWDYNTQPPFTTDMSSVTSAHVPPFTLDSVLDSLGDSTKNKEDLIEQEARVGAGILGLAARSLQPRDLENSRQSRRECKRRGIASKMLSSMANRFGIWDAQTQSSSHKPCWLFEGSKIKTWDLQ